MANKTPSIGIFPPLAPPSSNLVRRSLSTEKNKKVQSVFSAAALDFASALPPPPDDEKNDPLPTSKKKENDICQEESECPSCLENSSVQDGVVVRSSLPITFSKKGQGRHIVHKRESPSFREEEKIGANFFEEGIFSFMPDSPKSPGKIAAPFFISPLRLDEG